MIGVDEHDGPWSVMGLSDGSDTLWFVQCAGGGRRRDQDVPFCQCRLSRRGGRGACLTGIGLVGHGDRIRGLRGQTPSATNPVPPQTTVYVALTEMPLHFVDVFRFCHSVSGTP